MFCVEFNLDYESDKSSRTPAVAGQFDKLIPVIMSARQGILLTEREREREREGERRTRRRSIGITDSRLFPLQHVALSEELYQEHDQGHEKHVTLSDYQEHVPLSYQEYQEHVPLRAQDQQDHVALSDQLYQ